MKIETAFQMIKNEYLSQMSQQSNSPFSPITDKTPVRLPMTLWLTTVAFAFAMGGIWFTLKADVTALQKTQEAQANESGQKFSEVKRNTEAILKEVQVEQKAQRELLIRIDERVKKINEKP